MASPDSTAHIENTAERDPLLRLACAYGDPDRYITEMESAGQAQFVQSDRLPTNSNCDDELRALGFELGEPDPADPLFRPAKLPPGWSREGSDHAMHSYIVDANGRRRVAIFYKAAWYDRRADMQLRTIQSEVIELVYGDEPKSPVIDEWTTREAWITALTAYRDRALRDAEECESYYPQGAEREREHAARCDQILAGLVSS